MDENHKEVKKPPLLFEKTQTIVQKIEQQLGYPFLVYWTSSSGSVCDNDVLALYDVLRTLGQGNKVGIFIKSDGGDVEAALRIVNLIREYYSNIIALVPLECASAATMIALGADEISMGALAHLTAIDSSLTHDLSPLDRDNRRVSVSQDELARIIKVWGNNAKDHHGNPYEEIFKHIHPLVVGAIDRSSSLSIKICKEILSYHIKDEAAAEQISWHLNSSYPSHSYPITAKEAARIGLRISKLDNEINDLLLELNQLYSEMAQRAVTDYDEFNHHDNEILNILESSYIQIYYQNDKDWHYIKEERRWRTLNDESSWRKTMCVEGEKQFSQLHIR